MKSGLSADNVLRHMVRISFLIFTIPCVHIYLSVSVYITDWILSSALEATHGSAASPVAHLPHAGLSEAEESPGAAGDTLTSPGVLRTQLRALTARLSSSILCLPQSPC